MHGYSNAFLLRNNELKHELAIIHVPKLDDSIFSTRRYRVVLVKLMELLVSVRTFYLILPWRHILKVYA